MSHTIRRRAVPGMLAVLTVTGLIAVAGMAAPAPAGAQSGIEIRDIAPGDLRVEAFRLERPAMLRIEAVGAEAGGLNRLVRARNAVARFVQRVLHDEPDRFDSRWSATAWILDAGTREVVWRLDTAEARPFDNGLHAFDGEVRLDAGTYEVYYANFPDVSWRGGVGWEYDREAARRLRLSLTADDHLAVIDPNAVAEVIDNARVVALGRDPERLNERIAFDVARDAEVEVYMLGEATRSRSYDHGWIIDANTREPVWSFDWVRSQPAGGTARNRVIRERITLPAGSYAAFFTKDRSHGPAAWRSLPPGDPAGWGLSITPLDPADLEAFRTYAYEPVRTDDAIVSMIGVGDGAALARGFTLTQPLDLRIFALGEGRSERMFDYAWIQDARTNVAAWTMEFESTRHAGGTTRNRMFDGIVQLPAGSYIVHYSTDGSHSFDDWNAAEPTDAAFWGVTVLPATGSPDPDIVQPYDEAADPDIIARITQVQDSRQVRRMFELDEETDVRIYALGEGAGGEMVDGARIVDAQGREIWRMRYEETEHAGGASKNRRYNRVIRLVPGSYELIYRTDDSHAWGDWNATPPQDAGAWGVTLRRER